MGSIGRVDIGADGAIARLKICRLMPFPRRSPHSIYIFACVEPGTDNGFALVMPYANTEAMQQFLDRFASRDCRR